MKKKLLVLVLASTLLLNASCSALIGSVMKSTETATDLETKSTLSNVSESGKDKETDSAESIDPALSSKIADLVNDNNDSDEKRKEVAKLGGKVLSNTFLNFQLTVPKDWRTIAWEEKNLNDKPETTDSLEKLEHDTFDDGSYFVEFITLENLALFQLSQHITWDIVAEQWDASMEDIISLTTDYMLEATEDAPEYILGDSKEVSFNGIDYYYLSFSTDTGDKRNDYKEDLYLAQSGDILITHSFVYWADYTDASKDIEELLSKNVSEVKVNE